MKRCPCVLTLCFAALVSQAAGAQLSVLVKTGDVIDGYTIHEFGPNTRTDLNNSGLVVFPAGTPGGQGFFTQHHKVNHIGDVVSGVTLTHTTGYAGINESGVAAYGWEFNGAPHGIFNNAGLVAKEGDVISGHTLQTITDTPDINDSGTIAFYSFGEAFTQNGIVAGSGDVISGKTIGSVTSTSPSINNSDAVAFTATFTDGSGSGRGIFTQNGLLVRNGQVFGGKTLSTFGDPSINNSGDVACWSQFVLTTGTGILKQNSLIAKSGDVLAGHTLTSFGKFPTLNDSGVVAYLANYSGGSAIFTDQQLLVQVGDTLDGKTFASFGNPTINDLGAVSFMATFTDGSGAIVLATLPEPASWALMGFGLLAVALCTMRRAGGVRS